MAAVDIEVEPQPDTLTVEPGEGSSQKVVFTATHRGATRCNVRLRLDVEPAQSPLATSFEIQGDTYLTFEPNQTIPITVGVRAPPPDVAAGEAGLRLRFVGESDTEDDQKVSGRVAVTVKTAEGPGPKYWLWGLVAAVVVLLAVGIGVAIAVIRGPEQVKPGLACTDETECTDGSACFDAPGGGRKCLFALGQACLSSDVCVTGRCEAELCVEAEVALGDPCVPEDRCAEGARCMALEGNGSDLRCLAELSAACVEDLQCQSGRCKDGACAEAAQQIALGGFDQPCRPGRRCKARFKCVGQDQGICKGKTGFDCEHDDECASLACRRGECSMLGESCRRATDCAATWLTCQERVCRIKDGQDCDEKLNGLACASGSCKNGKCTRTPACTRASDCGAGGVCINSACFLKAGTSCSADGTPCEFSFCGHLTAPRMVNGRPRLVCPRKKCTATRKCPNGMDCTSEGRCKYSISNVLHGPVIPRRISGGRDVKVSPGGSVGFGNP